MRRLFSGPGVSFRPGVTLLPVLALLALAFMAAPVVAQDEVPAYYQILYVKVKPDKMMEYQQAVQELFGMYKKLGYKYPIQARSFPQELTIRYITPMDSLNDLAKLEEEGNRVRDKGGKALADIMAKVTGASESTKTWVFRSREDLSYMPENPHIPQGEAEVQVLQHWHIQRDKVAQAEANAKEYADLFRKNGINRGFFVLESILGPAPLYVAVTNGKSMSELYTTGEKQNQKLGAAGQQMFLKALAATSDYYAKNSANMPDLSYEP